MKPRLLIIGTDSMHTVNYYHLVREHFSEIGIITSPGSVRWGDIPVTEINMSLRNPSLIPGTIMRFRKAIRAFRPDIIHIHQAGTHALYATLALQARTPVVVTAWGSDILQVPEKGSLYRTMVRYILRKADYCTADSHYLATVMKDLASPCELKVDTVNFGLPALPQTGPKEKLVYSNRLHKELYRIDAVLKAFKRFLDACQDDSWQLVVAGEGYDTPRLKDLAEALGISTQTRFVGFVDAPTNLSYYASAAVYISVPESDATAISLLEAMAAGCRPIVSDLPSNREWIQHGHNGIVATDLDANMIQQALDLDYTQLMETNLDLIRKKAMRDTNRQRFLDIYQRLLVP